MLKIIPQPNMVYLKIEEVKAGDLVTTSRQSAVEYAEVLAVGENVENLSKGDKIFVKAWAIDQISHNDQKYFFVDQTSNGILAKVN